jgi:integrase
VGVEQEKTMSRRSFGHTRKLPSKKVQASYVASNGRRINAPHTFLTKADANAWLSKEEVKISRGENDETNQESLGALPCKFEEFIERHITIQTNADGSLLRESTKSLYRRLLRVNLRHFHGRSIQSLTAAEISEWWAAAIENGKKTSASKAYKLLSASMRRAVGEKRITSNPCMVKGAQSATSGRKVGVPSLEEVGLIAQHINPRYSKMVILKAFGGFRFGEITELRRKDASFIYLEGKRAYSFSVERAVTLVSHASGKSRHKVDAPKSAAGIRPVVVSSMLTPMIEEILSGAAADPESLLFPAATGSNAHLRHDVFMNSWRPALKRAGIPAGKFAPHGLRHFAGSHLHLAGANIPELKEWLGDSSTAAVMRYVHSTGRTASLADRMGRTGAIWKAA